jgi:flagellar biosynthetic protein FlhB
MSEEGGEQDKSEKATPHKLMQARRKGVVARGMDLGFLAALGGLYVFLWLNAAWSTSQIQRAFREALNIGPQVQDGAGNLLAVIGAQISLVAAPVITLAAIVFGFALVFELAQTGFVFSAAAIRIDFGKLNPGKGLKRVFSKQMLIELAKTLLKVVVYVALAVMAVSGVMTAIVRARAPSETFSILGAAFMGFLLQALFAAACLAALDQLLVRRSFAQRMRMSRREVKREVKDREGDPRQKQQRKRLHAEYVKTNSSLSGVKGADVVIINPTHFAVALRYAPETMSAPKLTAAGRDHLALRLKRLAMLYSVPIIDDAPLARLLFRTELGQPIPEETYDRVASIYRRLDSAKQRSGAERGE